MLSFVRLTVDEIAFDPAHAGDVVTKACLRHREISAVTGLCDCGESVVIPIEEVLFPCPGHYYFAQFPDPSSDGISSEIRIRYESNMSFLGSFRRGDEVWGLFFRKDQLK